MGLFSRGTRNTSDVQKNGASAEPEEVVETTVASETEAQPEPAEQAAPSSEPVPSNEAEPSSEATPAVPEPDESSDEEITVARVEEKKAPEPPLDPETIIHDPDEGRISADAAIAPKRTPGVIHTEQEAEGRRRHAVVYAFANQKGGVAKTTTTLNLAVAFAESGHRVLAVDLDPQGNLTMSQGIDPDKVEKSMFDVLVHRVPITEIIQEREIDIAVASIDLAGAEIAMSTMIGRERSLEKALDEVDSDYDFVCIDTPPSLGLLTVNALTAADKVIVPVQCEYLSMRGLVQLQNTLEMIRENLNPGVKIEGILPTMLDSRTVHAKEAVEILEENFGDLVFKSRIRKAIKFAEAPVRGASVLKYDPKGNAAEYYRDLAKEVLTHGAS
jgi:chromosome partitioning protein